VAGHNHDHLEERNLDRWARLNVEADAKLVSASHKVYKLINDKEADKFWKEKEVIPEEAIHYVNLALIDRAMSGISCSKQQFITKHTVGMCGVRKLMARWKKWEKDECP